MIRPGTDFRFVHLAGESGTFEVDFQAYPLAGSRTVFLRPGQYVDIAHGAITARERLVRDDGALSASVLFTHVYEVGSISCVPPDGPESAVLTWAEEAWHQAKPLHPGQTPSQTERIMELSKRIDQMLHTPPSCVAMARSVGVTPQALNRMVNQHTGRSLGRLMSEKRLTEARRRLAFSTASIREVGEAVGYNDAAQFSKRFSRLSGESPDDFRRRIQDRAGDPFIAELFEAIDRHYLAQDPAQVLAATFGLDRRSLDAKVHRHTGRRLAPLLRRRRAMEAVRHLSEGRTASATAEALGFPDPYTFSRFVRRETGRTPRDVQKAQQTVSF